MMMKILDRGPWRLALNKLGGKFKYQLIDYSRFARNIVVDGVGACKKEALENLLETWRTGRTELECPARSREELGLKLTLLEIDEKKEKRREDDNERSCKNS